MFRGAAFLVLWVQVGVTILQFRQPVSGQTAQPICKDQMSSCSCQTDQGLIDLKPLDSNDPNKARFFEVKDSMPGSGDYFSYNPCSPFSQQTCENVAVCQHTGNDKYFSTGEQDYATFDTHETDGLRITYLSHNDPTTTRTTHVRLICDEGEEGSLEALGETEHTIYKLALTSKYACPGSSPSGGGGLSVGSILLIVFAVLVVIYLIGGVIYNKAVKGAMGWEMLPNYAFWREFPGLVKDGALYLWRKTITGTSKNYDEI